MTNNYITPEASYSVSISCETVSLPPFEDILVLAHRCPQGKIGVSKCLSLLSPDDFEMIPVEHHTVEAIIVNKKILKKMPASKVISTLQSTVFPMVTEGELLKVDFKFSVTWKSVDVNND
ncbi:MAG: hypothetical protein ACLFNU_04620 [Bacteroidales bacterium]